MEYKNNIIGERVNIYMVFNKMNYNILVSNRPLPSSRTPLFQNEGRCSAFDMEIIFQSHTNKTHFHNNGCAPSLVLKVRVFGTRKWPIRRGH